MTLRVYETRRRGTRVIRRKRVQGGASQGLRCRDGDQAGDPDQVDVGDVRLGYNGLARQQARHQEQHGEEGVAPEDVAEGQLVVTHPYRGKPGGDLRQCGGRGKHRGPEQDSAHVEMRRDALAAALEQDTAGEGHPRPHGEHDPGPSCAQAPVEGPPLGGPLRVPPGMLRARSTSASPATHTTAMSRAAGSMRHHSRLEGSWLPITVTVNTATTVAASSSTTSDAPR